MDEYTNNILDHIINNPGAQFTNMIDANEDEQVKALGRALATLESAGKVKYRQDTKGYHVTPLGLEA